MAPVDCGSYCNTGSLWLGASLSRTMRGIVIESNHDVYLLRQSNRPWPLKQRILGPQGHLSNDDCAALVTELAMDSGLRLVVLAHLSCECNEPGLARRVTETSLRLQCAECVRVVLAAPGMATEVLPVTPRPAVKPVAG